MRINCIVNRFFSLRNLYYEVHVEIFINKTRIYAFLIFRSRKYHGSKYCIIFQAGITSLSYQAHAHTVQESSIAIRWHECMKCLRVEVRFMEAYLFLRQFYAFIYYTQFVYVAYAYQNLKGLVGLSTNRSYNFDSRYLYCCGDESSAEFVDSMQMCFRSCLSIHPLSFRSIYLALSFWILPQI